MNWIEEFIAKKQIKYYDYDHFNNMQEIGFGSFGKVYRANWKSSHSYLALKSFFNFNAMAKEIVNELKLQREIDFHENIIRYYGITTENQSSNSKKYFLVMEYANNAFQLASAISFLHDEGIVHRDLHSNNVLVDEQKSFELYQNAANSENASGIASLGYCYNQGIGTNVDK
ncbi:unnamed protein product [Rhizophagus irregularis]|nr:unnamed protein product [Rhizophagus irregularis]